MIFLVVGGFRKNSFGGTEKVGIFHAWMSHISWPISWDMFISLKKIVFTFFT
jgi:hypothetical protein